MRAGLGGAHFFLLRIGDAGRRPGGRVLLVAELRALHGLGLHALGGVAGRETMTLAKWPVREDSEDWL